MLAFKADPSLSLNKHLAEPWEIRSLQAQYPGGVLCRLGKGAEGITASTTRTLPRPSPGKSSLFRMNG